VRRVSALLLAALFLPLVALTASPAHAGPMAQPAADPQVGDCFDLSDERLRSGGWWTQTPSVPCTQPHTYEVTETGILPADVNAFDFAADRCGSLDVWTAVGVNMPVAGVVGDPLRIEPWSFAVREAPGSYVCGAVAVDFHGREPVTAVTLTSSIERLGRRASFALRYCSSAQDGRRATAPAITVPCTTRPRWQVAAWIVWTAFYDGYPGRAALRERATELCGPKAVFSLPPADAWGEGLPRTWCYRLYP
jgi:hypothetical protein